MDIQDIVQALQQDEGPLPRQALAAAAAQRDEITPVLLQIIYVMSFPAMSCLCRCRCRWCADAMVFRYRPCYCQDNRLWGIVAGK